MGCYCSGCPFRNVASHCCNCCRANVLRASHIKGDRENGQRNSARYSWKWASLLLNIPFEMSIMTIKMKGTTIKWRAFRWKRFSIELVWSSSVSGDFYGFRVVSKKIHESMLKGTKKNRFLLVPTNERKTRNEWCIANAVLSEIHFHWLPEGER